jgi:hypothetical protein
MDAVPGHHFNRKDRIASVSRAGEIVSHPPDRWLAGLERQREDGMRGRPSPQGIH